MLPEELIVSEYHRYSSTTRVPILRCCRDEVLDILGYEPSSTST